jgi:anaerobic magnesium-protoporphyrin IX monomethyl ester cyclase
MSEKTDILLINPFSWIRDGSPAYLPYGVLYLAGYLRGKGIKVDIFDANADYSDPLEVVARKKPLAIGLSVLTGPVINEALKISRAAKSRFKDIKIIWGGLHPTLFPKYVLREDSVDYIVQAEGENAIFRLMDSLLRGSPDTTIRNIGYKDNGQIFINPVDEGLIDLNLSPMPAWDLVDISKYIANRFFASRVLTMNTSRGCPFKCAFCFNQGLSYQRWRSLNARNIIKQLICLKDNYGINGIQFYEDSFDTDKSRVKEFCNLMMSSKAKVNWSHFSNIIYCDESMLRLEKAANCKYVEYGVESGSDRILQLINKRQNVAQIKEAFQICKRVGIKSAALFMIGYPSETKEELKETIDLVEGLPAHILIGTIYRPYPGTPLYDYCAKNKNFDVPATLEEQGEFYRFSHMKEGEHNMSSVPTEYLLKLQRSFYAKFAIKEAILCLREFNFGLMLYYLKRQIRPRALWYTFKSLLNRIALLSRKRI